MLRSSVISALIIGAVVLWMLTLAGQSLWQAALGGLIIAAIAIPLNYASRGLAQRWSAQRKKRG